MKCQVLNYYKYKLLESYERQIEIYGYDIADPSIYTTLTPEGMLIIHPGFAWDGATNALNTKSTVRGSLIHDVFYQLFRLELLPVTYKSYADRLFRDICREDGMNRFRAWYFHKAVKYLSGKHGTPGCEPYPKKILQVP